MRRAHICLALTTLALPSNAQLFTQSCPSPQFPSASTAIDSSCKSSGSSAPQSADGLQNIQKNNFCPLGTPTAITLTTLNALQAKATAEEHTNGFKPGEPPPVRTFLKSLGEGDLVTFEGYVFEARQECKESVNCDTQSPNLDGFHDIHISLVDHVPTSKPGTRAADAEECGSFVAEMIPHHRPAEWNACNVNSVATQKLRVRVTGQRMFDGSHLTCNGITPNGDNPKRSTLWEIHPIYGFEVCPSGDCPTGGWVPLTMFAAGKISCTNTPCEN